MTDLRMRQYKLKILHQHELDRVPMTLQELPSGLRSYISLPRYASMKLHVDNALLRVWVMARRLRLLTWASSCLLLLSVVVYFVLLLVHIQEDCDEMLGYMLPGLCPILCFSGHWMLHKFRSQRTSSELQAALKHLRGLLAWENQKFNGVKLLLKSNLEEDASNQFDVHIQVTLWHSRNLLQPSEVDDVSLTPDDDVMCPVQFSEHNDFTDITAAAAKDLEEENRSVKL